MEELFLLQILTNIWELHLAAIGRPVTILAASSCKWSSLLEFTTPQLSHTSLAYSKELGWESLTERRKRRKLQMFYNIQNNNSPMYLYDLIPPSIQSTTFIHCVMEMIL
jgi:hypothetical protein